MPAPYKIVNGIKVHTDITGMQFGLLTALHPVEEDPRGPSYTKWRCHCSGCGNSNFLTSEYNLKWKTQTCGCGRAADITGKHFGQLTVIQRLDKRRYGHVVWLCHCECGRDYETTATSLVQGKITRCNKCAHKAAGEAHVTHGMTNSPEYLAWNNMLRRCYNANYTGYDDYGGRGITVCDRWKDSFEAFYDDMGKHPGKGYSVDREDVNGNYEPSNCRWATRPVQSVNRRVNRTSKSGVAGVFYTPKSKKPWKATAKYKGKLIVSLLFDTFEEAVAARKDAERKIAVMMEADLKAIPREPADALPKKVMESSSGT